MSRRLFTAALFALPFATLTLTGPAKAQDDKLRDFGEGICWSVVTGGMDGISSYYQETAEATGIDNVDYCGCVGQAFVDNAGHQIPYLAAHSGKNDEAEAMQSIIEENLSYCLPLSGEEDGEIGLDPFDPDFDLSADIPVDDDEDVTDGDLADDFGGLGYDPQDALFCVQVIDGDFPARGFDAESVRRRITREGLNVSQICTCTAEWMAAQGEPLQDAIANASSPGAEWGTALGRGVMACLGE